MPPSGSVSRHQTDPIPQSLSCDVQLKLRELGLFLNEPEPAIICRDCRYALKPNAKAVSGHLHEKHGISAQARRALPAILRTMRLPDPNTLPCRPDLSPPHPFLATQPGAACLRCGFLSTSHDLIRRHLTKVHHTQRDRRHWLQDAMCDGLTLQSWTQNGCRKYWTVRARLHQHEPPGELATTAESGTATQQQESDADIQRGVRSSSGHGIESEDRMSMPGTVADQQGVRHSLSSAALTVVSAGSDRSIATLRVAIPITGDARLPVAGYTSTPPPSEVVVSEEERREIIVIDDDEADGVVRQEEQQAITPNQATAIVPSKRKADLENEDEDDKEEIGVLEDEMEAAMLEAKVMLDDYEDNVKAGRHNADQLKAVEKAKMRAAVCKANFGRAKRNLKQKRKYQRASIA
jgi:hypothetical protein